MPSKASAEPMEAWLTLFGSYARGDADEESDVDLLLRLRGPVDVLKEIRHADEVLWPLSLDYALTISLIPVEDSRD